MIRLYKINYLPLVAALAFLISLSSCSNQQKAEGLAKDYLESRINDPDSYSAVSFGPLTPSYERYEDSGSPEYKKLKAALSTADSMMMHHSFLADNLKPFGPEKEYKKEKNDENYWEKKKDSIIKIMDKNADNYHGKLTGFELKHTFRAKNAFNATILKEATFFFDENISRVSFAIGID